MIPSPSKARAWPIFEDIDQLSNDNIKIMMERADAVLKAQDDGLKAMETRMSSLFGQSVTLASAAVAATTTTFATLRVQGTSSSPPWAVPWVGECLAVISGFWLMAVVVAAASMLSQTWSPAGINPYDIYRVDYLSAPEASLRLLICRALQDAIDRNSARVHRYVQRLAWVVGLLTTGPLVTAAIALSLTRPSWLPLAIAIGILLVNGWLIWFLFHQSKQIPTS